MHASCYVIGSQNTATWTQSHSVISKTQAERLPESVNAMNASWSSIASTVRYGRVGGRNGVGAKYQLCAVTQHSNNNAPGDTTRPHRKPVESQRTIKHANHQSQFAHTRTSVYSRRSGPTAPNLIITSISPGRSHLQFDDPQAVTLARR